MTHYYRTLLNGSRDVGQSNKKTKILITNKIAQRHNNQKLRDLEYECIIQKQKCLPKTVCRRPETVQ